MKRYIPTIAAFSLACLAWGAPLTPEQALTRLGGDNKTKHILSTASIGTDRQPRLLYTARSANDLPTAYIFSGDGNTGYMILSADDSAAPLLGYSTSGEFDEAEMPDAMRWWLDEYARSIEYAATHSMSKYRPTATFPGRTPIEPMIKTNWDQTEPFNNLCPLAGTNRTYTGCVATSVAQVMNYWQYPTVGQGKISYSDPSLGKQLMMDFSKRPFDWSLMLDRYTEGYTPEQADAVAYLMRASAFAVKMSFSDDASSAYALNIADGMVKYFNYDPNILYTVRSLYSSSQWDEMIYRNLKEVGPVIYGGSSMMGGGHSFICDGYDGNGYYHFNWGWSGVSDGYFLLDALSPMNLGAGGGAGGGYNFNQDAVFGIQPPTGLPAEKRLYEIVQGGSLAASVKGTVMTFSLEEEVSGAWLNYTASKLNVTFGAIFQPQGATPGQQFTAPIDHKAVTLNAGYGTASAFVPQIDLSTLDLADGTYKVIFATDIKENGDAGWIPVRPLHNYYNYVVLNKKGEKYTVSGNSVDKLHITAGDIVGDLYYGGVANVTVTITNDSDVELSRGVAPAFFYTPEGGSTSLYFLGSSELVTVPPHSKVEHSWLTELTSMAPILSMNYEAGLMFTFFDENTYNFSDDDIWKRVVMKPSPGQPTVNCRSFRIDGATSAVEFIGGVRTQTFTVKDKYNIPVEFTASLSGTVPFCYRMLACIIGSTPEADGTVPIHSFSGFPMILDLSNRSQRFSATLAFPTMEAGTLYYIIPAYLFGSSFLPLDDSTKVGLIYDNGAGVETATADTDDDSLYPIYNLQGMEMGFDINLLPSGLYIRNGKKILIR